MVAPSQKTAKDAEIDMVYMQNIFQDTFGMPKIELHAHLGGSIRPQTFMDLAVQKNVSIDNIDFYKITMDMAFEIFKVSSAIVSDLDTLERVVRECVEDYAKQNTKYIEIRSTPKEFNFKNKEGDMIKSTKEQYIDAVIKALAEQEAKQETQEIRARFLISINRAYGKQHAKEALELLQKFKSKEADKETKYVVGIELSGDPRKGNWEQDYKDILQEAKDLGFKVSLHCGEVKDTEEECQSMIDFNPDRLGHCCYLTKDQVNQVVQKKIPVEICPSSNIATTQCQSVQFLTNMHDFVEQKHNIIICCDDTLVFGTNHSTEMFEFAKGIKAQSTDLKEMMEKNVSAIFDENSKEWLTDIIQNYRF